MLESPPFLKASADKKGKKERRCEQSQRRSFLLKILVRRFFCRSSNCFAVLPAHRKPLE
jgi:hypothetical protein